MAREAARPPRRVAWSARRDVGGSRRDRPGRDAGGRRRQFLLVDVIPPVGIFTMRPRRLEDEEPPQSQGLPRRAAGAAGTKGRDPRLRRQLGRRSAHQGRRGGGPRSDRDRALPSGDRRPDPARQHRPGPDARRRRPGGRRPARLVRAPSSPSRADRRRLQRQPGSGRGGRLRRGPGAARQCPGWWYVGLRADHVPGAMGWEPAVPKSPQEILDQGIAAAAADFADLEIEGRVVDGGSIPAAIAVDSAVGVDLVVVGSRGYGRPRSGPGRLGRDRPPPPAALPGARRPPPSGRRRRAHGRRRR